MTKRITPAHLKRWGDRCNEDAGVIDQYTSTVVQRTSKYLRELGANLRRLARQMDEPMPAKLPRGWALTERDGELIIVAPECKPGMDTLDMQRLLDGKGSLHERLLIALCHDILKERAAYTGQERETPARDLSMRSYRDTWVVYDKQGWPIYSAPDRQMCHDHINDMIEHDIDGAPECVVRQVQVMEGERA